MIHAGNTIRPPVRAPRPRRRADPMLAVWAIAFLALTAGLVQGAEAIHNGWNPFAAADAKADQASPVVVEEQRTQHVCVDARGQPQRQDAPCPAPAPVAVKKKHR